MICRNYSLKSDVCYVSPSIPAAYPRNWSTLLRKRGCRMWGGRSIAVLFINSQLSSKTSKFCPKADLFSHRLVTEGCRSKLFSKEGGGGGRVEVVVKALVSSHAVSHPRPSAWSWSKGFSSSSPLYLTPYNKINISKLVFNLGSKNSIRCLLVIWLKNKLPYLVPILLTTCSHYWLNRKVIGPTSVGRTWSMPALLTKKKKKNMHLSFIFTGH